MRFASVEHEGTPLAVALQDGTAIPLRGIAELGHDTPSSVLRNPPLDRAAALPVEELRFRPVVPRPGKVVCVGLNYLAHVEETRRDLPEYPVLFTKFASTLTGPYDRSHARQSPARSITRESSWSSLASAREGCHGTMRSG